MHSFSTLLHLTDTHLGASTDFRLWGLPVETLLERCLEDARARFPRLDLVLHTGDATHDVGGAALQRLEERLASLGAPIAWTPGNHDPLDGLSGTPSAFELPGWRVLMINSRRPGAVEGWVDEATLAWLDEALAAATTPVLLALHHPPLPLGTPWLDRLGLVDAERLWAVIRRHARVKAILHGHAHMEQTVLHEGVLVLGTPSTHGQFRSQASGFALDSQPPGYRWLRLHRDGRLASGVVRVGCPAPG